jgi:hypothetical protein
VGGLYVGWWGEAHVTGIIAALGAIESDRNRRLEQILLEEEMNAA